MNKTIPFLNAEPVAKKFDYAYRTLTHITSLDAARAILKSGKISGDRGIHANFSAGPHLRVDLAKCTEVLMRFKWLGDQYICYDHIVDHNNKTEEFQNQLFHVYVHDALEPFDYNVGYWQSIIYPESNGLIFEHIEILHHTRFSQAVSEWPRQKLLQFRYSNNLRRLNETYRNNEISVVDPCGEVR